MIKTFKEIRNFNVATDQFCGLKPTNLQTKLGYALKRVSELSIRQAIKDYQLAYTEAYYVNVQQVQIDNALTDKATGAILLAPKDAERPYQYDKAGLKKVLEAERKWNEFTSVALLEEWDKKEFDIITYYATELPGDLKPEFVEAFMGFVIDPAAANPVVASEPVEEKKVETITS